MKLKEIIHKKECGMNKKKLNMEKLKAMVKLLKN